MQYRMGKRNIGGALFLCHWPKSLMELGAWLSSLETLEYKFWIALKMKSGFPIKGRIHPAHYGLLYYVKKGAQPTFNVVRHRSPRCRNKNAASLSGTTADTEGSTNNSKQTETFGFKSATFGRTQDQRARTRSERTASMNFQCKFPSVPFSWRAVRETRARLFQRRRQHSACSATSQSPTDRDRH
jgi:hypothetical protein